MPGIGKRSRGNKQENTFQTKGTQTELLKRWINVGLLWWHRGKEFAYDVGDVGSTPGSRRSPGEGNGKPLQYSRSRNLMVRGAWQAIVHGVVKESDMTPWLYNNNNKMLGWKVEGMIVSGKDTWEIFTEVINLLEQGFLSGSNGLSGNSQCNIMMTSMRIVTLGILCLKRWTTFDIRGCLKSFISH